MIYGNTSFPVAIHAMASVAALTERWKGPPAQATTISKSIDTHEVLVRRILGKLTKAGLLEVKRGVQGGYLLRRPSKSITLADIFQACRGNDDRPFLLHPKRGNPSCPVSRSIKPLLYPVIEGVHEGVLRELKKTSLYDLVMKLQ